MLDFVELVFAHALVVVVAGEVLVVLEHQFGVCLVGVECVAVVTELVVVGEGGQVNPLTRKIAVVVLAVCSAVNGGIAVAIIGFVRLLFGAECFDVVAKLCEACGYLCLEGVV